MQNRSHALFTFLFLIIAAGAVLSAPGPITVEIPATPMAEPDTMVASWDKCFGNTQGGFPQYCNWLIATGTTTYDSLWIYLAREGCSAFGGDAEKRASILEFDISGIPDTATISDVSLILTVDSLHHSSGFSPQIQASDMLANSTRPSERGVGGALTNLTDALGGNLDDTDYFYGKTISSVGSVAVHLNDSAIADFTDQLDDNWFALGMSICELTGENDEAFVLLGPRVEQRIKVTYYSPLNITVRTDFDGGELIIDDSLNVTSPYVPSWEEDEVHVINTDSIQTPGLGVKYLYRYWSDGGDKRHSIHISTDTTEYVAYFDTLYQLIIHAPGYTNPSPIHPDSVWFDPRAWATITIEPCTAYVGSDSLERHIFQRWEGTGVGSYTGTNPTADVRMNEAINQYAVYDTSYWLELDYTDCGTGTPAQIGEGWATVGDSVNVMTQDSIEVEGAWYFFQYWSGGAGHLRDSTDNITWFVEPNLPRTLVAHYQVDPRLSVFPDSLRIVSPGHYVLIPAILEADIDYPVDSFRLVMEYNEAKLDYSSLVNSSVIWGDLTATPGSGSVTVFGDAVGSVMEVPAGDTLFYFRMQAALTATNYDTLTFRDFEYAFSDAETRPGYVHFVPEDIDVTVTTSYGGDSVWIDSAPEPAPYSAVWTGAATREIGADSLNPLAPGERARFIGWGDGGARFHDVTPISDTTFTAIYDTLLYLDVVSDYGTPTGSGWFDRGDTPNFSVTPETVTDGLSRHVFTGWTGTGTGSYTGTDNPASCTMSDPITETADWQRQYWLELEFSGAGAETPTLTGEGWADDGAWVPITAEAEVGSGASTYYFAWWSGGGVEDRFEAATNALVSGVDTITAVYADVPFSFALDIPETSSALPGEHIHLPVVIDIPTATEFEEISFSLYFDDDYLEYAGVAAGDLPFGTLTGTDLSSGSDGRILVHGSAGSPLPVNPGDTLCILDFVASFGISGESEVIAGDAGHDIAEASPDTAIAIIEGTSSVTVTTSSGAGLVSVDGLDYSAPFDAAWLIGSVHEIGIDSVQFPEAGTRIEYRDWSDGGARVHDVSPAEDTTFTANLETFYRLDVFTEHGTPTGAGWYSAGADADFSVSPD